MKMEEKLKKNLKHKSFLILNKYIPHLICLLYIVYTILGFFGIDTFIIGSITDVSALTFLYLYTTSIIFRYCYVHRLPLYYIAINELITCLDYYVGIPISDFKLLIIHILVIGCLIFGYSYYYIKFKLNNERL